MSRPNTLKESLPGLGRVLRYFWPHISKQWLPVSGALLALIASVALRLLEPWPLKFIIDYVIGVAPPAAGGATAPPPQPFGGLDTGIILILSALAVVVIAGLRALATYWSAIGFALVGNRVVTEVRYRLFKHLQALSLSFHSRARGGDLTMRVISDIGQLRDAAVTAMLPMLGNSLVLVGMLGVMFWLNWELTLVSLAGIPLFFLLTLGLSKRIQRVAKKQREREGAIAATTAETIGAIKIVQAFSLQRVFSKAFAGQNKKSLKEGVKGSKLSAALERAVDVVIAIGTALALLYGTHLVLNNTLTAGDLLVFLAYLKNAFKPVQDFAKYTARIAKASAAGERVITLLEKEPEVRDLRGATPAPALRGAIRFEGVSFAYEPGHDVLKEVSFAVEPGRMVALVGPSGGGKSTITNLAMRFYDPREGRVAIDGRDIRDYTIESLRAQISVVMQDSVLFAASVRENIAYGLATRSQTKPIPYMSAATMGETGGRSETGETGVSDEEIVAAARLANAHNFIRALPEGYDTVLSERGVSLSGGQRQRIAIARAALRNSAILILDEPTTGLDESNQQVVVDALMRLATGRTTLLVTHDLSLAARADLIIHLEDGRIVERGTHDELIRAGGRYATMFDLRMGGEAGSPVAERREHALRA